MEQLAGAGQPVDFSLIALFLRASFTVQIVMVMLILASFWSWSIIIRKFITFAAARREADRFDRAFWSGQPLDDLYDRIGETLPIARERHVAEPRHRDRDRGPHANYHPIRRAAADHHATRLLQNVGQRVVLDHDAEVFG